jgi:uncharacterized membrane protein SpoIIM required for sporulation
MNGFVSRNKPVWDQLEELIRRYRKSKRSMQPEDLMRLDTLYRRTTVHLSQVSTRSTDLQLEKYLNSLVSSAHRLIYLPPRRSIWRGTLSFLFDGFARVVARNFKFHLLSASLITLGGLIAYYASRQDPQAAYALMPAGDVRQPGSTPEQLLQVLRSGREMGGGYKFFFASFLFSHNLKVGILALGTGILAAIPTVFLMVFNGMLLGSFAAIHHQAGITTEFWAWILPHGVTEIGAIALCGGCGLMLGRAVVSPGIMSRTESLRHAGIETGSTCLGVAIMLIAAAIIESYLRQSHLPSSARLIFAGGTALFWAGYFYMGLLRERMDRSPRLQMTS